jgi:hypothetical protein
MTLNTTQAVKEVTEVFSSLTILSTDEDMPELEENVTESTKYETVQTKSKQLPREKMISKDFAFSTMKVSIKSGSDDQVWVPIQDLIPRHFRTKKTEMPIASTPQI